MSVARSRSRSVALDDSIDETSNRLFFRLFRASNTLQTQAARALEQFGVTATQWSVLGALSRQQVEAGMSISELSDYLCVSRQNLAGVLSRLERNGWIARTTNPTDARSRVVRLTAEGQALWGRLTVPIGVFYEHTLRGFSEEDRERFIDYITRIQQAMVDR